MEAVAKLKNVPTSPRKMRYVVDLIRNKPVSFALSTLQFNDNAGSYYVNKVLRSAIANWQSKNPDLSLEDANLHVTRVFVDGGRMLKRLRPAPQGRAHRIRKRSNHITLVVDSKD
jgi:large subunit ribosomal protein L22